MTQPPPPSPLPSKPSEPGLRAADTQAPALHAWPGYWNSQLAPDAAGPTAWLWHGYLAPGGVTVLTSQWKSGKTSLVAVLLARMARGGLLAGLAVRPGRGVVISEEPQFNWQQRNKKLHFGDNVGFLSRPFRGKPTMQEWSALVDALVLIRQRDGLDLVVIDPLVNFLPGRNENLAAGAGIQSVSHFSRGGA
ncbi:MAG TPA: AAA family ATPase [Gemmataceae bacterium]|jgi:hypothetical protein|nr:AAA family ATPase [Gemmataceae bacterium]